MVACPPRSPPPAQNISRAPDLRYMLQLLGPSCGRFATGCATQRSHVSACFYMRPAPPPLSNHSQVIWQAHWTLHSSVETPLTYMFCALRPVCSTASRCVRPACPHTPQLIIHHSPSLSLFLHGTIHTCRGPLFFITCYLYLLARRLRPGSSMRVHAGRRRLAACIAAHMFPKQRAVLVEARATCPQAPYQVDSNTKEHCMLQFSLETLPSNRPSPRPPQSSYMFQSESQIAPPTGHPSCNTSPRAQDLQWTFQLPGQTQDFHPSQGFAINRQPPCT